MKELVVLSGKGGTGKTSITGALAHLVPQKVLADCDVDAANLHLIAQGQELVRKKFFAGFEPQIDLSLCIKCGKCNDACRFKAIEYGEIIRPLNCEGCAVCTIVCPANAIAMKDKEAGDWLLSSTRYGLMVHAELGLSIENSGKLVSKVRTEARNIAEKQEIPLVIIDGPPGIGCPTIAALSGASLALTVVEPSLSSMHDLERVTKLIKHFRIPQALCINKASINIENVKTILNWCDNNNIPVVGQFDYNNAFYKAIQQGKTITEMNDEVINKEASVMWNKINSLLS